MVLMVEPIDRCISELKAERAYDEVIYMTPDGETLDQKMANGLSLVRKHDHPLRPLQRRRPAGTRPLYYPGNFHWRLRAFRGRTGSGGVVRCRHPDFAGVLNDETSALTDTFQDNLLAPPVYTRPREYKGLRVPEVLLSGDFPKIEKWREEQAQARTKARRPDLLK